MSGNSVHQVIWRPMKDLIRMKNPFYCSQCQKKKFSQSQHLKTQRIHTDNKHSAAQNAKRSSINHSIWRHMKEFILVKNHILAKIVINLLDWNNPFRNMGWSIWMMYNQRTKRMLKLTQSELKSGKWSVIFSVFNYFLISHIIAMDLAN